MRVHVIGTEKVAYTSKKTGLAVSGISLHAAFKDPAVFGEAVDKIFISDNLGVRKLVETIQPGMDVNIETNFRGAVIDLSIIPGNNGDTAGKPAK